MNKIITIAVIAIVGGLLIYSFTTRNSVGNEVLETTNEVSDNNQPENTLPENGPETNQPVPEWTTVKVFFANSQFDPEMLDCQKVYASNRTIKKTPAIGRAALTELLNGPTETELQAGYLTSINSGVQIQSLTIENGLAKVDFSDQLESQVGGSCRVTNIRSQITETLKQFPTVSEVQISVNGRIEDILQP